MSLEEIHGIALVVKCLQPKAILEFGTFDGTTTLQMAMNSLDETRIYALNLPPGSVNTKYPTGTSELDSGLPSAIRRPILGLPRSEEDHTVLRRFCGVWVVSLNCLDELSVVDRGYPLGYRLSTQNQRFNE
jgi:hypothetical protein